MTRALTRYKRESSVADLVALGLVIAVGACGGPYVPLRGGRIDATGPGPVDVSFDPETPLNTTLKGFAQAGFSQEEAITLTACGHTMGGYVFPYFSISQETYLKRDFELIEGQCSC